MKKINFKTSSVKIFSYVYSLILILGLIALIFVSLFLYNNFYSTILTLSDVVVSQEGVNENSISMAKFEKVIKNLNIKEEVLIDNSE